MDECVILIFFISESSDGDESDSVDCEEEEEDAQKQTPSDKLETPEDIISSRILTSEEFEAIRKRQAEKNVISILAYSFISRHAISKFILFQFVDALRHNGRS